MKAVTIEPGESILKKISSNFEIIKTFTFQRLLQYGW